MDSNTQQNETRPLPSSYPGAEYLPSGKLFMLPAAAPGKRPLAFWKVTAIGLGAGLAIGGTVALSGMELLLTLLSISHSALAETGIYSAAMLSLGLLGAGLGATYASFQSAEKTPLSAPPGQPAAEKAAPPAEEHKKYPEKPVVFTVRTMVYTDENDEPAADTQSRDRLLPSAREALLSMDHTKVTPN